MTIPDTIARVRGCLLGGAIGDALGNPIEFASTQAIRRQYGPSGLTTMIATGPNGTAVITDDTQMTLFTAEALTLTAGDADPVPELAAAYQRWYDTQLSAGPEPAGSLPFRTGRLREQAWLYHRRAPGNACLSGLAAQRDSPVDVTGTGPGPVNPESKGCGTVMRSAPFGVRYRDPMQAYETAATAARLTHGHPTAAAASGVFAVLVNRLLVGEPIPTAVRSGLRPATGRAGGTETVAAVMAAIHAAADDRSPAPETVERLGGGWTGEEALAIAVYCAMVHPGVDRVAAALTLSVNHSGDSDSTGAICGNLLGAAYGEAALPADWAGMIEHSDVIVDMAEALAASR